MSLIYLILFYLVFVLHGVCLYDCLLFDMKRVRLSIDYGPRLIGLAKSDIRGKVRSFDTIENTWNLTQIAHKIARVVNQIGAYEIILGVPMDPNQKTLNYRVKNLNGQLCLNFSTVLANVVHSQCKSRVSVRLYDERYSSFEAKHILWTTNRKGNSLTCSYIIHAN